MKTALIGCGHIAQVHLRALRALPDVELVGVADAFGGYARELAGAYGVPKAYESVEQMLDECRPDAVHVLTPPANHYETALACLARGIHTLVEKPLALSCRESESLLAAAAGNKVVLSVDHNYQFEPVVQKARKILAAGKVGHLVAAEVDYAFDLSRYPAILQPGAVNSHWVYRLHGGPLEDQIAHPLSLLAPHLDEIRGVTVYQRNCGVLPAPWSDEIRVIIDGHPVQAEVYISFCTKPDAMVLTLRGTQGTITADLHAMTVNVDVQSVLPRAVARGLSGFRRSWQACGNGISNVLAVGLGRFDKTAGVSEVVAGFYDAIRTGGEPRVTMHEGHKVVGLIRRIWPDPVRPVAAPAERARRSLHGAGRPRILVTGATGFIGSHLVDRLIERGESVRALARPNSPGLGRLSEQPVEIVYGDLSNADAVRTAMKGVQAVYHAGGAMGGNWDAHRRITVEGTQNVVDAALAEGVERVVHFSSLVVYHLLTARRGTLIDEAFPHDETHRLGPYSRGKVEAEKIVVAARDRGLPITIVRPGMVIGPRGRVFFPHMGYRLRDRMFVVLGPGRVRLPLVYIDNLVAGVIQAMHSESAVGKAYNLVDDGQVTVNEYLSRFATSTEPPAKIVHLPYFMAYSATGMYEFCAALGIVAKGVTSRAQLAWKHKSVGYSNASAKQDFGFESLVPIADALDRTFRWYLASRAEIPARDPASGASRLDARPIPAG